MMSYADLCAAFLSFFSSFLFFPYLLVLFYFATFVLVDQRHRNAVVGFGFGLLGCKYSSEHVLVMVVAVCARTVGPVYYNRERLDAVVR